MASELFTQMMMLKCYLELTDGKRVMLVARSVEEAEEFLRRFMLQYPKEYYPHLYELSNPVNIISNASN